LPWGLAARILGTVTERIRPQERSPRPTPSLPPGDDRGLGPFARIEPIGARRLAAVAGLSALCTALLWLRTDHLTPGSPYFGLPWDHHMYIFMATHGPLSFHVAPFGWRVLGPLAVWALPGGVQGGFQALAVASVALTGVALWAVCRRLGFGAAPATAGMLLYFSLGYATKWTLFDFWLSDPLAFLLVVGAVLLALSGRDLAFAVCLVAGVLAKESAVFVAPLFYTLRARRPWDPALAARTAAVTLPAVAALVAVHLGIPAMNSDPAYVASLPRPIRLNTIPHYTYGTVLHDTVVRRLHHWPRTVVGSLSAFGVLVPALALVGLRRPAARSFALRAVPFLLLVYVQLLFAFNTERLLVLGVVALVPLALWGVAELMEIRGSGPAAFVALAGAFTLAQLAGRHEWEPNPLIQLALLAAFFPLVGPWNPWRGARPVPFVASDGPGRPRR